MDDFDAIAAVAATYDLSTLTALRRVCDPQPVDPDHLTRMRILLLVTVAADAGLDAETVIQLAEVVGLRFEQVVEFMGAVDGLDVDGRVAAAQRICGQ